VVTKIGIVKVWIGKGMISKPIPTINGLIGLITSYTTDGVAGTLLLVPISTYTKLGNLYLKSKKIVW